MKIKQKMIADGVLVENGDCYELTKEHLFKSPSAAASIIFGASMNGKNCWKTSDGKTINDLEKID